MLRKIKTVLCIKFALLCMVIASLLCIDAMDTYAADDLNRAVSCSFLVPSDFVPGNEKGLFINRNTPMESSTIKYSFYDNGNDKILTNRERLELEKSGEKQIVDASKNLTKQIYEDQMTSAYNKEYGQDVGFYVSSFENISIDGFPGYKIVSSYQLAGEETVHQTVYIVLSKYRMFTIAYQRAEDDDCQELFEASAKTIHVK